VIPRPPSLSKLVDEVARIERELDDHPDGENPRPPTGDDYNDLFTALAAFLMACYGVDLNKELR
jgi:hypothetical protein